MHEVSVPTFNLLYSLPSAVSIIFIIPLGILYDKHSQAILLTGAIMLLAGQVFVAIFGPNIGPHSYKALIGGRILEGTGA